MQFIKSLSQKHTGESFISFLEYIWDEYVKLTADRYYFLTTKSKWKIYVNFSVHFYSFSFSYSLSHILRKGKSTADIVWMSVFYCSEGKNYLSGNNTRTMLQ